jgi:hypothetical protein
MGRRPVRISLFLFALLATAGLGYRAWTDEQGLAAARQDGAQRDQAMEDALSALLDLRGSMYAYVAPNQGTEFWSRRVGTLLDTLRQQLVTLDAAAASPRVSLADSLDGLDQLSAADKRARQHVDRGEMLLAGDVLFTEVRDLLTAATEQLVTVRNTLRRDTEGRIAGLRQEQAGLAAGGVGLWLIVALMLLPAGKPAAKEPGEWRQALAETIKKPASVPEGSEELPRDLAAASAFAREEAHELRRDLAEAASGREGGVPQIDLKVVAEICADLSALSNIGALSGALARASDVIGAKGLIVWVTSSDGSALTPVSSHGFDPRVVDRIGAIHRESANLTAEALRENAARVSAAHGSTAAAIAVPMCGPTGTVGVLSAELQPGRDPSDACVAVASILAAQLATLTAPMPMPVHTTVETADAKSAAS